MRLGGDESYDWMPNLVEFKDGNWERYLILVYRFFQEDFIHSKPIFRGLAVNHRHFPKDVDGKHAAFWHLIQEGNEEENREPNLRRCERIRWPRPIIEHEHEENILVWENERSGKTNICIFFSTRNYLIVLGKRSSYLLLLSAYPIEFNNRKKKLINEYHAYHGL